LLRRSIGTLGSGGMPATATHETHLVPRGQRPHVAS
jgi:hypothetical protein